MQIEIFHEDGKPAGTIEVPDEIMKAAQLVYDWLTHHKAIELHGLTLAE